MVKQEITEIKKLYHIKECSVLWIAGCYVNPDKEILARFSENFLNKEENEIHKYLEIFKKGLSGKVGKELNTLQYVHDAGKPMQDLLQKMIATGLKESSLLEIFWERVIKSYSFSGNVLFLMIHNTYDVPGRGNDNFKNPDVSDEVYDYVSFYVCPVQLEDAGLCFEEEDRKFARKNTRWCVQPPVYSFLYPSFEDRSASTDFVTVYTKKTDGTMNDFTRQLLQVEPKLGAAEQKQSFQRALEEAVSQENANDCIEIIKNFHEGISGRIADAESDVTGPVTINKEALMEIAAESGMDNTTMKLLEQNITENFGEDPLVADNIVDKKMLRFKTSDIVVQVSAKMAEMVRTDILDNTRYLLIPLRPDADMEVNGVIVKRE